MPETRAPSDDDLLLAAAAGDREAFGAFYRRYETPVLAYFVRRVRDPELAADLAGETFASALTACRRYRRGNGGGGTGSETGGGGGGGGVGSAAGWMFAIASRRLADSARRGRVQDRARRRLGMEPVAFSDEALERIERLGDDTYVLALLGGLPDAQREAIIARIVEERDYAEIAGRLSCSESVVRQRVSRGLATLRREMRRRDEMGEREHVDPA